MTQVRGNKWRTGVERVLGSIDDTSRAKYVDSDDFSNDNRFD